MKNLKLSILIFLVIPAISFASIVTPISYDTVNGNTGSYNYWDDTYTGSGSKTTDGAFLSGGLGDLIDGIIASDNWFITEAPIGAGPYVGWSNIDPTITFYFASSYDFQIIQIHFDDADGYGGVSAPAGVNINGKNYALSDPGGSAPFIASLDVSSLSSTDTLSIQLKRNDSWVFASEFQFKVVPVPTTIFLLGSGLTGLVGIRLRRKK